MVQINQSENRNSHSVLNLNNNYTMFYKRGKLARDFSERFYFMFRSAFNKTIIPLAFVGFVMIIGNSVPTRARGNYC